MGFIAETKELVFGKLSEVSDKVSEKVDVAEMKAKVTAQYTKAIATVEEVPTYLKDAYKNAIAKIEDLHIYDNAMYASKAAVDPATYKKMFDSALNAVEAFKEALVTFTKQTSTAVVNSTTNTALKLQHGAVAGAVWLDSKVHVIDAFNWGLNGVQSVDNYVTGGKVQMITVPVVGYTMTKAAEVDNKVLNGSVQSVVNGVTVDFVKTKAMTFVK
jgi:hypothetical protein